MSYKFIGGVILIFALFPYVSFFKMPFDTQPWTFIAALFFGTIVLIKNNHCIPFPLFILALIALYATMIFLAHILTGNAGLLDGMRSLVGYFSVFFIVLASFLTYRYTSHKILIAAVFVWFLIALLQFIFGSDFGEWLLSRQSAGGYRGVASLAPEPAYFARMCVAMLLLNEFFYREKKYNSRIYLIVMAALLAQMAISYSGMGMLFIALFCGAKLVSVLFEKGRSKIKLFAPVIIGAAVLIIGAFMINPALQETRGGYFLKGLTSDPLSFLRSDHSIAHRLFNPLLAFYGGIFETHGMGFGLGAVGQKAIPDWLASWIDKERLFGGRILGGTVAAVYELGVVGLIFFFNILWIMFRGLFSKGAMRPALMISALVLTPMVVVSESIAFPLFGYLIGVHLYYASPRSCLK